MPWIKFIADYDWKMNPHAVTAYKDGMRCLVTQACAEAAIGAGKAVESPAETDEPQTSRRRNRHDASR